MANTYTNPTLIKAAPHASKEKQVGDADPLSRTDVINRVSKGILYGGLKRLLNAIGDGLTFDFTSVTDPTTTGLPTFAAAGGLRAVVALTNKTGVALVAGDVVGLDTGTDSAVALADAQGTLVPLVVALGSAATDAVGLFLRAGIATVKTTGTVTRGDWMRKSATTLVAETTSVQIGATKAPLSGSFAVALTTASGNTCTAFVVGVVLGPGVDILVTQVFS